jgi:hypothetical protein
LTLPPVEAKVERFAKLEGKVIVTEYSDLGNLEANSDEMIKCEVGYLYQLSEKAKYLKVLRLTTKRQSTPSMDRSYYIDFDELPDLSNAINAMVAQATKWSEEDRSYTDVAYHTRDGFEVGFTQIEKLQSAYYKFGGGNDEYIGMKLELLSAFRQLVDKSIAKLKSK